MRRKSINAPVMLLLAALFIAACRPQTNSNAVLPTLAQLPPTLAPGVIPTNTFAPDLPTLPPSWTPSPVVPSNTPTPTQPTAIPDVGTLYYLYNNDSIAMVAGSAAEAQQVIYLGTALTDLVGSPDGQYLAFVGPASGSAREVFIINRDGTYVQQVSCLGYAGVFEPRWSPDSQYIAFIASQTPDGPRDIYVAGILGAGGCPTDNDQHPVTVLASQQIRDLDWGADSTRLFFTNAHIFTVEVLAGGAAQVAEPVQITSSNSFGPDYLVRYDAEERRLLFIRPSRVQFIGGDLMELDVNRISDVDEPLTAGGLFTQYFVVYPEDLLVQSEGILYLQNRGTGSSIRLLDNAVVGLEPSPVRSPNREYVAFFASDLQGVPQVFRLTRTGENPTQLTSHPDGTVSDLVWLP